MDVFDPFDFHSNCAENSRPFQCKVHGGEKPRRSRPIEAAWCLLLCRQRERSMVLGERREHPCLVECPRQGRRHVLTKARTGKPTTRKDIRFSGWLKGDMNSANIREACAAAKMQPLCDHSSYSDGICGGRGKLAFLDPSTPRNTE